MKKSKLIDARKRKGLTQHEMAENLHMDVSNYNRREAGQIKISNQEWEKLSELLSIPVEEIYEAEESNFFIFKDNSAGGYFCTNHIYSIPEYLLESQRKYIQKLEEENRALKKDIGKSKG